MPRNYSRIQQYEKEILRLKEDGYTKREIGENLGFSYEQWIIVNKEDKKL